MAARARTRTAVDRIGPLLAALVAADGAPVPIRDLTIAIYGADTPENRMRLHMVVRWARVNRPGGDRIQLCEHRWGRHQSGYRLRAVDEPPPPPRVAAEPIRLAPACWHPAGPCGEYARGGCRHCEDHADGIICPLRHRREEPDMRTY